MKFFKGLLLTLIVLAILTVSIDRIANWRAEREISGHLASTYQLASPPQVQIKGPSFLLQWIRGSYSEIDVNEPQIAYGSVEIINVSSHFHQISFSPLALSLANFRQAQAEAVDASAILPYAELPVPEKLQLTPQGNQLQLHGDVRVGRSQVPVNVLLQPSVDQGRLQLRVVNVDAPNNTLRNAISTAVEQSMQSQGLPPLPLGLKLNGVQPSSFGLNLSASASGIQLTS